MKIQSWRRLSREDMGPIPEGLGPLVDKLLSSFNAQLESISTALQNNLTIPDNFNRELVELDVADGAEQTVKFSKLRGKPRDAILTWTEHYSSTTACYARLAWRVVDSTTVNLRVDWEDNPAGTSKVRILFLGE